MSTTAAAARYSRQTAAYGEKCGTRIFTSVCIVAFQATTSTALAAETLKNLALSGVREVCLVDDGTPFDPSAHVGSNSLVHPFILQQEGKRAAAAQQTATVVDALVAGLRELNDDMIVTTVKPQEDEANNGNAQQQQQQPASWFDRVHSAIRQKYEQLSRRCGGGGGGGRESRNVLFLLLHPHDRRENAEMRQLFAKLEGTSTTAAVGGTDAAADASVLNIVPYMHVQTASVFGRLTNWFGRSFPVLDATPKQTVQATVASMAVEGSIAIGSSSASKNNNTGNDYGDDANATKGSRSSKNPQGAYITLIDDDISADSLSGNPISVDDTFRLIYTGNKAAAAAAAAGGGPVPQVQLLQQQLADFDARFDGFTVTAIETITNAITDKSTKRYYFSLNDNNKSSNSELPSGDALAVFSTWVHAAAAARMPLRFSQQPPVQLITNFDTAATHVGDLGSDTGFILRALTRCQADTKPVQSQQVADAAQEALHDVGARADGTPFGHTPILLKSMSPGLALRTRQAARTARLQPNFWASFLGAVAAQEALKFFTQRWVPASSPICFDMAQLLPQQPGGNSSSTSSSTVSPTDFFPTDAVSAASDATNAPELHYSGLFGVARLEQIRSARVFLVGAGALGCEYLKAFALMGIGASGKGVITVTDDDSIATSNLSRQLLFRPAHVGHNKSVAAVAAGKEMARLALKHRGGSISTRALQKRLDDASTHPVTGVFNHRFWSQQTILVSGVDNVKARSFLSEMSQQHLVPLVDGGTNGPLGHVAAIVPFIVDPLQPPPPDNQRIAVCTLHFFPTTVAHCSHHALHTFRTLFGEKQQQQQEQEQEQGDNKEDRMQKALSGEGGGGGNEEELMQAASSSTSQGGGDPAGENQHKNIMKENQEAAAAGKKQQQQSSGGVTLDDSLREACKLWFPMFVRPVLDLRKSKPPDALEADGRTPYYSPQSSRRCPVVPEFDPIQDEAHRAFVCSCAKLLLRSVGVESIGALDADSSSPSSSPASSAASSQQQQQQPPHEQSSFDDAVINQRCVELAQSHKWKDKMAELVSSYVPKLIQIPNDSAGPGSPILEEDKSKKEGVDTDAAAAAVGQRDKKEAEKEQEEEEEESFFSRNRSVEMQFEKDDEDIVEFVWAATVVRARAYSIFAPQKSDVQRIAGRMIPALITTTAVVVAAGVFNICALLLHHNPTRPYKNPRAGTAAALFATVSPADLKQSAVTIWDYMVNLSDGNNAVFAFQHILDTEADLDVENESSDKWLRAVVRIPGAESSGSDFSLFDLIATVLKQHLVVGNQSVGARKAAARAKHFCVAASAELCAAAGFGGGAGGSDNNTSGAAAAAAADSSSFGSGTFDINAVKKALNDCTVILKLRIGTSTQTIFQHTPSPAGGGAASSEFQVKDFPARMFLATFLEAEGGAPPPFVESEVLIHCGAQQQQQQQLKSAEVGADKAVASKDENNAGVTCLARLML